MLTNLKTHIQYYWGPCAALCLMVAAIGGSMISPHNREPKYHRGDHVRHVLGARGVVTQVHRLYFFYHVTTDSGLRPNTRWEESEIEGKIE